MKVYVFEYIDAYGGGLIFIGEKYKNLSYYLNDKRYYRLIGIFDLPKDFLDAIGLINEDGIADWSFYE